MAQLLKLNLSAPSYVFCRAGVFRQSLYTWHIGTKAPPLKCVKDGAPKVQNFNRE
jgi:hypothetical protein